MMVLCRFSATLRTSLERHEDGLPLPPIACGLPFSNRATRSEAVSR